MNQLLKLELRKLWRTKSFYITTIVSVGLAIVSVLMVNMTAKALAQLASVNSLADFQEFGLMNSIGSVQEAVSNGMVVMICGIFTAIFVCDDFSSGVIKNIYAKGYSRSAVFFSKYITTVIPALLLVVLDMAVSYVCGGVTASFSSDLPQNFVVGLLAQTCVVLAYQALFFMMAMMFTKLSISIIFVIVVPTVLSGLLALTDILLKLESFKLASYWLDGLLVDSFSEPLRAVLMSAGYIAVFLFLGCLVNRRKEV